MSAIKENSRQSRKKSGSSKSRKKRLMNCEPNLVGSDSLPGDDKEGEKDPYVMHTTFDLTRAMIESITMAPRHLDTVRIQLNCLGYCSVELPLDNVGQLSDTTRILEDPSLTDWAMLHVKEKIARNIRIQFDTLQCEMFAVLNGYLDLYYPGRNFDNADQLRYVYCFHALNHVLKAVGKTQRHTSKLKQSTKPVEYRDQGFVRPKVLIIVPFRESAMNCVNVLRHLFTGTDVENVLNWKRFIEEYGGEPRRQFSRQHPKPADYERTFAGNIDDNFSIGIAFNWEKMRLYAQYYTSDLIIASPLGLQRTLGRSDIHDRDYDFLANIELLIIDQAEVCYAQNWHNVLHVLEHLHLQPKIFNRTAFSRIREWCLKGWSKFYRQTVLLSEFELSEFRELFNKHFHNYRGKVRSTKYAAPGSMEHVMVNIPQTFHRIREDTVQETGKERFAYFVKMILPQARTAAMSHCMIYVPNDSDFVRLQNHLKQEKDSFTQISEYATRHENIARALEMFFNGSINFLLYSERAHYYRRYRIRGVRHLIIYAPPVYPQFYPELITTMVNDDKDAEQKTVTMLYAKRDVYQLREIFGFRRAKAMLKTPEIVHQFTSDRQ
ncbi:U3 small nucleolar RNA-associated protein 25 homolog [Anopheles maculipalpis]|uniref:U3 small nucleolar RNA-associated protein 25 homolog n=1 Tax=Anopheles maculipalpis TaxID=1496333 RepID=UPI0021594B2A|nr:U3 small nucleolar RNA-associated protein 25 homolog [Anopheles maculipalpis]